MDVLHVHQDCQFLGIETFGVDHRSARIRHRHHPRAELDRLLDRILGDVARTRHRHAHTLDRAPHVLEHLLGEIDGAIAGGLGPNQRTAKAQALAGEHAIRLVGQLFHHAGHETDLAPADTDVARRHIGIRTDMAIQLGHERLAKTHHFTRALALGIEIRAPLAAAHRERGQGVLERLLEGEKLEDRLVHRRMEAQPALVGPDGGTMLDAVAAINMHRATVIEP